MRTKMTVQEIQPRSDKAVITGLSYLAMLDTKYGPYTSI